MCKLVIKGRSVSPVPEVKMVRVVKSLVWEIVLFRFSSVSTVVPGPQPFYHKNFTPMN
jgi:hypothetical protein